MRSLQTGQLACQLRVNYLTQRREGAKKKTATVNTVDTEEISIRSVGEKRPGALCVLCGKPALLPLTFAMPQTATWIGIESAQGKKEQYIRFRRTVELPTQPASASVKISADSRYRLYINGKPIGFGPSRCYPHHQCADVHEVADALQSGENLIAVMVYQPGYSHYSYACREKLGLWLTLEVDGKPVLVSDDSWKASRDPSYSSDVRRVSIYSAGQEVRDLRLSEPWTDTNYNDDKWEAASVLTDVPWTGMQTAPLANPVEFIVQPMLVASDFGPYVANDDPHEVMRTAFLGSSLAEKASRMLKLPEVENDLSQVKPDEVHLQCYDLGHSQAGSAQLQINGARGGERILVSYFEKELDGQWILSDSSTYCEMRMTDSFILAPGENRAEPFTPRGGRFLLLGWVGPIESGLSLEIKFRSWHYPITVTKDIAPKDFLLQQIAAMCWRSIESCALDGMVDCPWREQAAWVGDSAITAGIVAELCDEPRLLRRMLELASQGVSDDGVLPGVVTHESDSTAVLAYSFAWVEGLAKYHHLVGDTTFICQHWKTLSKMLARFQEDLDSDGLLRPQPDRRHFLDWAELPAGEPSCLYNLRYLYALQLAVGLASRLEKHADATIWQEWAGLLSLRVRLKFCVDKKWYDEGQKGSRSQHIAAFLVLTGLVAPEEADQLLNEAVACSRDEKANRLVLMSPYMHYYLFLALQKTGRCDDLLGIVKHRWGKWLDQRARTTWENWEVDFPDGSQCHAWSAHPLLFIAQLAK